METVEFEETSSKTLIVLSVTRPMIGPKITLQPVAECLGMSPGLFLPWALLAASEFPDTARTKEQESGGDIDESGK